LEIPGQNKNDANQNANFLDQTPLKEFAGETSFTKTGT
jgi:hypothetical protein